MFGALLNLVGQDVDEVFFSTERGFYSGPFSVALSADVASANIYYSLDGGDPTPPYGQPYTSPLTITGTSLLRAVALTSNDSTKVFTHSYIFLNDILGQMGTPPGYPSMWDGYPADYDMNPAYVNDPLVSGIMMDAMMEIPSLSIVMDFDDLFGQAEGIYQNTEQRGYAWERPASLELINPDNTTEFHVNSGIRIHGASSRDPADYKKHAMRVVFRDEYGPGRLKHPLFGPTGSDRINGLVLRMVANFSPHDENAGRRSKPQFVKDQWAREAFSKMGHASADGLFAHVYLNGLYWGVYNIHDRIDAAYLEETVGGNKDTYDVLNAGNPVDGNDAEWIQMQNYAYLNLNTPADYDSMTNWLDMENYADYIILNHYGNNSDWPDNNWYAGRDKVGGDLWKFYPWDSEFFFQNNYNFTRNVVFNKGLGLYNKPTVPFHKMKTFPEFKMLFSDRVECNCYDEGILEPVNAVSLFKEIASKVDTALHGEYARWGDVSGTAYTYFNHELNTQNFILNDFLINARDSLVKLYLEKDVISQVRSVEFNLAQGLVNTNSQLTLNHQNLTGSIIYTLDGTDPRGTGGIISPGALIYSSPINITGITEVRARVYDGSEWSAMCPKTFYTAQNYSDIVINEIHYNPTKQIFGMDTIDGDEFEYIELKNVGNSTIELSNCSLNYGVQYDFPFGTKIAAGDFLVIAENRVYFNMLHGFDPGHQYKSKLNNGGETIQLLDPFDSVIDEITYDDVSPWPTFADGDGLSLSLFVGANNDFISSWSYETAILTPLSENKFCGSSNWTVNSLDPSDCGSNDGAAVVTFPGSGYSIQWAHGPVSPAVSSLAAGTYPFTVTDPVGCTKEDSIIIAAPVMPPTVSGVNLATANGSSAIISWGFNSGISQYEISYRVTGTATWNTTTSSTGLVYLTGLTDCTDYEVRVRAGCAGFYGGYSSTLSFNSGNCIVCTAPAGLYQFNFTSISAILTWDLLVGTSLYTLKYREVGSSTWMNYPTVLPIVVLFSISPCTDYEWTIETTCPNGSTALSSTMSYFSTECKGDIGDQLSFESKEGLKVYPNPADELVNIVYTSDSYLDDVALDIINISGQTVHSEVRSSSDNHSSIWSVSVSDFIAGEYIIRIRTSEKVIHEKLLVR